jgi:hypothetical protein
VVVERHRFEAELLAEPAHRQGLDPVLIDQVERGPQDAVAAEGKTGFRLRGH